MKAHQNRNMNYDEMNEYVMFNGAAQLAPQEMNPVDGLAPALPYSLGLISPSRHQQREVEGCNMCADAVSSVQPLEAVAVSESCLPHLKEAHVVIPCVRFSARHTTLALWWAPECSPSCPEMEANERGQPVPARPRISRLSNDCAQYVLRAFFFWIHVKSCGHVAIWVAT